MFNGNEREWTIYYKVSLDNVAGIMLGCMCCGKWDDTTYLFDGKNKYYYLSDLSLDFIPRYSFEFNSARKEICYPIKIKENIIYLYLEGDDFLTGFVSTCEYYNRPPRLYLLIPSDFEGNEYDVAGYPMLNHTSSVEYTFYDVHADEPDDTKKLFAQDNEDDSEKDPDAGDIVYNINVDVDMD
jgi:hypothetical protein